MSQLPGVDSSNSEALMLTDGHYQRQSRFYTPQRGRKSKGVKESATLPNSYDLGSSEKNNGTAFTHYRSIPSATSREARGLQDSSLPMGPFKVLTPSKIGKLPNHAASLISSPPRASRSVKISKIFQDAQANLINTSRKSLGLQNSPTPTLSTSRHRRAFGSQHPPPTLCGDATALEASRSWNLADVARPQFPTVPQAASKGDYSQAGTVREQPTMGHSNPRQETTSKVALKESVVAEEPSIPTYDTVVKYKTENGSPQLPPFEPVGDLFKDVAGLIGPPNPVTPPYERSREHPLSSIAPRASPSRDEAVRSPTGTWSDDHIFFPKPSSKVVNAPQSPLSQPWTDDSKFYHGPSPSIGPHSQPTSKQSNEEAVLTWLNKVNSTAENGPFSPPLTERRDSTKTVADEFNIHHTYTDAASGAIAHAEQVSTESLSRYVAPSPGRLGRSDSTCSSPPRVTSDSQSPPLSPLSTNVEIERGKHSRPRSRTASYYDMDILKVREVLQKEERRKARLRKYGC